MIDICTNIFRLRLKLFMVLFFYSRKINTSQKVAGIVLHPHDDKIFAHSLDAVKCFDIATGIAIQTFDLRHHAKDRYNFTISPCGSYVFTTYQQKIIGWCLYASSKQFSFCVPAQMTKQFISSMNFHPNGNLLSVSVYGANGSIFLLSNSNDGDGLFFYFEKEDNGPTRKVTNFNLSNTLVNYNNTMENNKLTDIIRRVDEIFNFGSAQLNKTDDHKVTEKYEMTTRAQAADPGGAQSSGRSLVASGDSSGTFTVKRNASISSSNRTFKVSTGAGNAKGNDGTYNVDNEDGVDSDHTTISDSSM